MDPTRHGIFLGPTIFGDLDLRSTKIACAHQQTSFFFRCYLHHPCLLRQISIWKTINLIPPSHPTTPHAIHSPPCSLNAQRCRDFNINHSAKNHRTWSFPPDVLGQNLNKVYIYIVYIYYMDNYAHSMWYGLVWSPISQQESQAWTYVYISTKGLMTITQSIIIVAKPTFYIFVPHVWLWISQVHWPYGKSTSSSCYKSFHIISISCSYDADHSWDFPYLLDLFPCFKDIPWRPSKLPGPIAIHIICSAVLLCMTPGTLQILWLEVLALSSGRKS